ncbi:MAG: methyl-accepting chemotaxis protein [Hasllibacter sp.]
MPVFDPQFDTEIPPEWREGREADRAFDAISALPELVRLRTMRLSMFAALNIGSEDPDMRAGALHGTARALQSMEVLLPVLEGRAEGLHAEAGPWLAATAAATDGAVEGYAAYLAAGRRLQGNAAGDGRVRSADLTEVLRVGYGPLHGGMNQLRAALTEALARRRRGMVGHVLDARGRAQAAMERIEEVGHMVRMISLNARVEAANVGEAGRGFAVIADEIGALSQSAEAAGVEVRAHLAEMTRGLQGDGPDVAPAPANS